MAETTQPETTEKTTEPNWAELIAQITTQQTTMLSAIDALKKRHAETVIEMAPREALPKLYAALSKAQGAMASAARDATNPFFSSKYADLSSVWDALRKPFSDNELAIIQLPTAMDSQKVTVETRLCHASGEMTWCKVTVPITAIGKEGKVVTVTAQHIGSAITYARRFGLAPIAGVTAAGEDDDGNTASSRNDRADDSGPPPSSTPPQARAAGASATQPNTVDSSALKAAIPTADDKTLDAMVEKVSSLPEGDEKKEIRQMWGARKKELKKAASAKPEEKAEPAPEPGSGG